MQHNQFHADQPSPVEPRNATLIDLSFTPEHIQRKIIEQYEAQKGKDRSKLMNYFIANKLKNLAEYISEF